MTIANWLELGLLIVAVAVTTPLLGGYMAKVYDPSLGRPRGDRVFSAVERVIYVPIYAQSFNNGVGPRVQESSLGRIPLHYYTAPFEDIRLKAE